MNEDTSVVLTVKLQSSLPKFANHCVHGHPTICFVLGIVFHFLNIRYIYLSKLQLEKCFESEFSEFWVTSTRTLKNVWFDHRGTKRRCFIFLCRNHPCTGSVLRCFPRLQKNKKKPKRHVNRFCNRFANGITFACRVPSTDGIPLRLFCLRFVKT